MLQRLRPSRQCSSPSWISIRRYRRYGRQARRGSADCVVEFAGSSELPQRFFQFPRLAIGDSLIDMRLPRGRPEAEPCQLIFLFGGIGCLRLGGQFRRAVQGGQGLQRFLRQCLPEKGIPLRGCAEARRSGIQQENL